jgi:hypothetical protein
MSEAKKIELLERIAAGVDRLGAILRRQSQNADVRAAIAAAVAEELGNAKFTSAGLWAIADEDPSGEIAQALAAAVDPASPSRSVLLGIRLKAWKDEFEAIDEYHRGARLFRLRGG